MKPPNPSGEDKHQPSVSARTAPARLLDKEASAQYLSTSTKTVERLVHAGVLPVVKLPVERGKGGRGEVGTSRRVLVDVRELDALIERSMETSR